MTARRDTRQGCEGISTAGSIGFAENFSPIVKLNTIRSVSNIVTAENIHLEQLDVKTVFLHDDLKEDIYIVQPQGYVTSGNEYLVCKLKKGLK